MLPTLPPFPPPLPAHTDADRELRALLSYPLAETVAGEGAKAVLSDNFQQIAETVLAAYDSGDLAAALGSGEGGFKVGCPPPFPPSPAGLAACLLGRREQRLRRCIATA